MIIFFLGLYVGLLAGDIRSTKWKGPFPWGPKQFSLLFILKPSIFFSIVPSFLSLYKCAHSLWKLDPLNNTSRFQKLWSLQNFPNHIIFLFFFYTISGEKCFCFSTRDYLNCILDGLFLLLLITRIKTFSFLSRSDLKHNSRWFFTYFSNKFVISPNREFSCVT